MEQIFTEEETAAGKNKKCHSGIRSFSAVKNSKEFFSISAQIIPEKVLQSFPYICLTVLYSILCVFCFDFCFCLLFFSFIFQILIIFQHLSDCIVQLFRSLLQSLFKKGTADITQSGACKFRRCDLPLFPEWIPQKSQTCRRGF